MNKVSTNATNVRDTNIMNVATYPPEISKTLFDAEAINEATMALNAIKAILLEKCFMP